MTRQERMAEIGRFVYVKYRRAAIRAVASAVKDGRLPRPSDFPCEDCGRQAAVYDHRDYGLPMNVAPVCDSCNHKRGMGHLALSRIDDDLCAYHPNFDEWARLTGRDQKWSEDETDNFVTGYATSPADPGETSSPGDGASGQRLKGR